MHVALPPKHDPFIDLVPDYGLKLTPKHYAYLKISEGCNHRCSFCIIPSMRGDLVSRPVDDVLREAEKLVRGGVKELLVVSQDTSAYGVDVKYAERSWRDKQYQTRMKALCEGLSELGAWTRLHYVYPYPHVDEVIPLMAEGKILPYLDIPFQHASPRVLKLMKRPGAVDKTLERIQRWRATCPQLAIRSTFIVGFPGETEAEFEGCWTSSTKRSSIASAPSPIRRWKARRRTTADPVDEDVKQERLARFMDRQAAISAAKLEAKGRQRATGDRRRHRRGTGDRALDGRRARDRRPGAGAGRPRGRPCARRFRLRADHGQRRARPVRRGRIQRLNLAPA